MSRYKRIKTQLTDRDALLAALDVLEIPYEVAEGKRLSLYGYRGRRRNKTADIVVRRQHIGDGANDLGFAWDEAENRYNVIISEFDEASSAPGRGLHVLNQIKQMHAVQQVTALAEARGYVVQPVEAEGGVVRLQLVQY